MKRFCHYQLFKNQMILRNQMTSVEINNEPIHEIIRRIACNENKFSPKFSTASFLDSLGKFEIYLISDILDFYKIDQHKLGPNGKPKYGVRDI